MGKYTVIRDKQEKENYWNFPESSLCEGTIVQSMKTGDYTLRGYEDLVVIERKFSTGELSGNISQARFERELVRLEEFRHPYLICEFDFEDLFAFPTRSGIPPKFWSKLKVSPGYLVKRVMEIDLNYKTKIIFAGVGQGQKRAELIFKYIMQKYG